MMTESCSATFQDVFFDIGLPSPIAELTINDLCLDSRAVRKGSVFFAVKGQTQNREDFIENAFDAGAIAIVKESITRDQVVFQHIDGLTRIEISVCNLKSRMGAFVDRFFKQPSSRICLVGITGTNGKTSCTELLAQVWRNLGLKAASLGTLGWSYESGEHHSTGMTTLDVIENHRLIKQFVDDEVTHVVMEVSSHGIDQGRVSGLAFNAKVLTNITRDHLDYHGDMERYAKAKLSFLCDYPGLAIFNCGDDMTRRYLGQDEAFSDLSTALRKRDMCCFNASELNNVGNTNVYPISKSLNPSGIAAKVQSPWGVLDLNTALVGEFNLQNLLAVFSVVGSLSTSSINNIEQAFKYVSSVPGRLQRVALRRPVFIDYAHTSDALENVLSALRDHNVHRLILVFGCGGDRDKGKRPMMGAIAEKLADLVIVTSDNPRTESPSAIVHEILTGMIEPMKAIVELDRRRAIALALSKAEESDIVLIAGKGHEDYQEINGERFPFSDHDEVKRLIA